MMKARVLGVGMALFILGMGGVWRYWSASHTRFSQGGKTDPLTIQYTSSTAPDQRLEPSSARASSTRILFVGDIMLDRNVARRIRESQDPAYPFRKLPSGWFDSFDYAVGNLEGPVTDKRRPPVKSIDFQFDPSVIPVLKVQGLDALSQANNHALDQGQEGFADSRQRLQEAGFVVFGHEVRDDEIALATTTVNGVRFAFLGFNTTDNVLNRRDVAAVIEKARTQAEYVVVFMHWGVEYRAHPEEEQRELAYWFVDHGVDAVIGGHPHWVQGFERYKNKPIAYSLGNFIFDQDFSRETREGLAVVLTFGVDQIGIEPIPIQIDESQPRLAEGEEKARRLENLNKVSF